MRRTTTLALVLLAPVWAACDRAPAPPAAAPAARLVLEDPAPEGARLRLQDGDVTRDLAPGLAAAWACALHHEGVECCFLGRAESAGPVGLYLGGPGTPAPVRIDVPVDEASAPTWLPDGRIVYTARAPSGQRALFVTNRDGVRPERITFGATDCADPTVLPDGRVLHVGATLGDRGVPAPALFTLHPDGTGVALFHAATRGARYSRPRAGADGRVAFLVHDAEGSTTATLLDPRAPAEPGTTLALPAGVTAVEPFADGTWLACGPAGTRRIDARGATLAAIAPPAGLRPPACVLELGPRRRPQGHMSMVDATRTTGQLLCVDARPPGGADTPAAVRLFARRPGADGRMGWQALGTLTTEADGSFFVTVPADTPLRIEVEHSDGRLVASQTPFWVRRGEVRGCTGCHDAPDTTPPNRRPLAVLRAPIALPAPSAPRRSH